MARTHELERAGNLTVSPLLCCFGRRALVVARDRWLKVTRIVIRDALTVLEGRVKIVRRTSHVEQLFTTRDGTSIVFMEERKLA